MLLAIIGEYKQSCGFLYVLLYGINCVASIKNMFVRTVVVKLKEY